MNPLIGEVAKLILESYFAAVKQANMTASESDQYYQDKKREFMLRDPANLPDV